MLRTRLSGDPTTTFIVVGELVEEAHVFIAGIRRHQIVFLTPIIRALVAVELMKDELQLDLL